MWKSVLKVVTEGLQTPELLVVDCCACRTSRSPCDVDDQRRQLIGGLSSRYLYALRQSQNLVISKEIKHLSNHIQIPHGLLIHDPVIPQRMHCLYKF